MARRDEGGAGITQRTRVLKDVWADSAGNVVDQAGSVVIAAAAQALVSRDGRAVRNDAVLGDSITFDWWNLTSINSSPSTRNDEAVWLNDQTFELMAHGWASWLGPLSMGAINVVYNGAVNGAELIGGAAGDGTLLSTQVDALLAHPKWATIDDVIIKIGTNDSDANNAQDCVACVSELLAQANRLLGKRVVLCSILPVSSSIEDGSSGGSSPRWAWIRRFNALVKQACRISSGRLIFADINGAVVDPTSTTARAKTGILRDTLHPTTKAAPLMAQAVVSALLRGQSYPPDWLTSNADDVALGGGPQGALNIVPNGLFVDGASPGTGWTFNNFSGATGSHSLVTDPNGFGQALQVASSGAAKGDSFRIISASAHANVSAGDRLFGQFWVRLPAGASVVPAVRLALTVGGVTYLRSALQMPGTAAYQEAPTAAMDLLIRTPEIIVPGGTITNVQLSCTCTYGAAAGPNNILIGHGELRKVIPGL